MDSVYELIIYPESDESEKDCEMLFPTPQQAFEHAQKWNNTMEDPKELPDLSTWVSNKYWRDGIQLILSDWAADGYTLIIVQRTIHGSA